MILPGACPTTARQNDPAFSVLTGDSKKQESREVATDMPVDTIATVLSYVTVLDQFRPEMSQKRATSLGIRPAPPRGLRKPKVNAYPHGLWEVLYREKSPIWLQTTKLWWYSGFVFQCPLPPVTGGTESVFPVPAGPLGNRRQGRNVKTTHMKDRDTLGRAWFLSPLPWFLGF